MSEEKDSMPGNKKRYPYDHTAARIAGNLLSGAPEDWMRPARRASVVSEAVATANDVIAEVIRTAAAREQHE